MNARDMVDANRRLWNERVPIHVGSRFYDVAGWKAGARDHLVAPFEADELGPVEGLRLCHLQCHIGMDTLTLARQGATVVGVDFSRPAVEAARALAAEVGLTDRAAFVESTVEDARDHLDGDFDIVYSSWGFHIWLDDLWAWSRTIASLLRPGGFVYLADQHPLIGTYDPRRLGGIARSYFDFGPHRDDTPGSYADADAGTKENEGYEWQHTLGDLVTAVAAAGLRVDLLHEHPVLVWQQMPEMEQGPDGMWRLPDDPIPLSFSLKATKDS